MTADDLTHPILLYDGVCGLCNRTVQFVLKRDRNAAFRFAALQSALARQILTAHRLNSSDLDTFYVVIGFDTALSAESQPNTRLLARSDALGFVLRSLGGVWRFVGFVFGILPRSLRDWGYNFVARRRYRMFGKYDSCPLPTEETRARFLDI